MMDANQNSCKYPGLRFIRHAFDNRIFDTLRVCFKADTQKTFVEEYSLLRNVIRCLPAPPAHT